VRLIDYFDRGAAMYPERDCLVDGASRRIYADVEKRSHRLANGLLERGLVAGDRVAILSPNAATAFEAWIGVARAGGVWVGLAALATIDDNVNIINDRGATWLFYHADFCDVIEHYRTRCPSLVNLVCLDESAVAGRDGLSLEGLMAGQPDLAPDLPDDPDAIISHFTTGGTTGEPKGSMWSNLTWEAWTGNVFAHLPITEPPVFLAAAAMSHATGVFVWPYMAFGATTVCVQKADPVSVMEAISTHGVTHTFLPPTIIYMMLSHESAPSYDFSTMRHMIYGGAPMSTDKVREAIEMFGPCMAQVYGQAEVPCTIGIMSPAEHVAALENETTQKRLLSCGRPAIYSRVAIMDDDGNLMPRGEAGEIVVRGDVVHAGYYGRPEATEQSLAFGWHHTGDIGYLDPAGYLFLVDRKKDMIISGGLNVYPIEIERALWGHAAVQDCAVVGVPDEKWGEAVTAVVELKTGESATEKELVNWCREKVAAYKVPKAVHFRDQLPRSGVGKVLRRKVRDEFWAHSDRQL